MRVCVDGVDGDVVGGEEKDVLLDDIGGDVVVVWVGAVEDGVVEDGVVGAEAWRRSIAALCTLVVRSAASSSS